MTPTADTQPRRRAGLGGAGGAGRGLGDRRGAWAPWWRRLGGAGGAVTLCVVLLAPVSVLAAVAAVAVPQRLAAESALHDAAHDIGDLASSRGPSRHPVPALSLEPSCSGRPESSPTETETHAAMCAVLRSLGAAGFATETLRGYYTNTLHAGVGGPDTAPAPAARASDLRLCAAGAGATVAEAVYVSLAGDWSQAGWAASQIWPDGLRLGSEALALRNPAAASPASDGGRCDTARGAVNTDLITAAAAGDPVVRHRLRSEP